MVRMHELMDNDDVTVPGRVVEGAWELIEARGIERRLKWYCLGLATASRLILQSSECRPVLAVPVLPEAAAESRRHGSRPGRLEVSPRRECF